MSEEIISGSSDAAPRGRPESLHFAGGWSAVRLYTRPIESGCGAHVIVEAERSDGSSVEVIRDYADIDSTIIDHWARLPDAPLTASERHELECLRHRVQQLAYPCSPHCDGYLREMAIRNMTAFLADPDDAWAERYCTYVGWSPDGAQVSFNSDGAASITFREMAKNYIRAAQLAWLSTRAETAPSSEAPPSEAARERSEHSTAVTQLREDQ